MRRRALAIRWLCVVFAAVLLVAVPAGVASGQGSEAGAPLAAPAELEGVDPLTPLTVLDGAAQGLGLAAAPASDPDADDAGAEGGRLDATLSILLLLTVLSLSPAFLVMCTSFTRIIVVLALLRQAIGLQQLPPAQVITGLALLLTFMVMAPTMRQVHADAIVPYEAGLIGQAEAWEAGKAPVRAFMFDQIEYAGNWDTVYMLLQYQGVDTSDPGTLTRGDVDMLTLVPAFVLSELKVAFLMGFRLYLPFLVIDMVISSVLISMGMLMLPPVFISLPFKLLLFVLVDGWRLVAGSLLESFAV